MPTFKDRDSSMLTPTSGDEKRALLATWSDKRVVERHRLAVEGSEADTRIVFDEYRSSCGKLGQGCLLLKYAVRAVGPCNKCRHLVKADYYVTRAEMAAQLEVMADNVEVLAGVILDKDAVKTLDAARARLAAAME